MMGREWTSVGISQAACLRVVASEMELAVLLRCKACCMGVLARSVDFHLATGGLVGVAGWVKRTD